MSQKFWQNNKNHFLQYFDETDNLSASGVYDRYIKKGDFKEMERIVSENTKFNCTEYLVRLEAEFNKNKEEK